MENSAKKKEGSMIQTERLSFSYGNGRRVLADISLSVSPGESVGIIGRNGAGKSTFLKVLVGLLPGYEGSVSIGGLPLEKKNYPEIRRRLGYVFQDSESQLFMNRVAEDVAFGPRNYGLTEEEVKNRVQDALAKTHTENLAGRHIYRLSGGEKKLAAIAAVLAVQGSEDCPEALNSGILMDEPSASLDPANRENLIEIIRGLSCVKLIASHDLDFIYDTCERTVLLSGGRIVYDGDTKTILRDRKMLEEHGLRLPLSFRFMKEFIGK